MQKNISFYTVTVTSFTAASDGAAVQLQWSTLSEKNIADFIISYSTDGKHWETLDRILPEGNANTGHNYQYCHADAPVAETIYYKLEIATAEGVTTEAYKMISVMHDEEIINSAGTKVYYNLSGKSFTTLAEAPSGIYIAVQGNTKHKIYLQADR